jgi:transcription elongation GreA/GreB family factor
MLEFMVRAASGTGREIAALNRALTEIEETLARTPTIAGESRNGNWRVLIASPVSVIYRVDQTAREVLVRDVHYSPRKHP